jgi:hypothetical protein
MSHHASLLNKKDPLVVQQVAAQAVDGLPTSNSPTMPDLEIKNTTGTGTSSTNNPIVAFLVSMKSHYETLSDPVTPHLFTQLCKDYNTSKFNETSFYVAAYRLFFETNATHLVPGLRAFLPSTWRDVDMEWLNKAVEGDSERQRASAREVVGELAAMVEIGMSVPSTPSGSAVAKRMLDLEVSTTQPAKNKKKKPLKGFRATYRTDIESPLRSGVPTPRSDSDKSSIYHSLPGTSTSPASSRSPKNSTSPPTKKLPIKKNKTTTSTTPTLSTSSNHATPLPPAKPPNLPPASTITHLGPIYPTTRAIIARSHKPYIHALCGMAFGHPAEVQRHHNGQGGRPGCWEKSGKPAGDEGRWDRHESCKAKLAEVQYVKVQEGWVVTSWGSAEVERVLREDAGEEVKGGIAKMDAAKAGEGKKRKVSAKPQQAPKTEPHATSESENGSASEDDGEVDEYTESQSPQEPGAKRQKMSNVEEDTTSVAEEHAAVRAAALGLRRRK